MPLKPKCSEIMLVQSRSRSIIELKPRVRVLSKLVEETVENLLVDTALKVGCLSVTTLTGEYLRGPDTLNKIALLSNET